MSQFQFRNLLRKYLNGQATETELRLIDRWYDRLNADVTDQFTEPEQARLKARMWQQIDGQTADVTPDETPVRPLHEPRRMAGSWLSGSFWRVAAAAVVLIAGGWYGWVAYQNNQPVAFRGELAQLSERLTEQRNTTGKPLTLRLSDGSFIDLMPQSAIRYPQAFAADSRTIYLTGTAFFNISKDARRPFRIFTNKVVTQVLGTSFWVKAAHRDDRVAVEVRTGKVSVYERPGATAKPIGVVLTPNQKVTVSTGGAPWKTGLVARPLVIQPEERPVSTLSFAFAETPLSTVLDKLSKAYGIELTVANPKLETCTFSGNISRLPFYTQLELICKTIGASYDVQGTRIVIQGRGCADR